MPITGAPGRVIVDITLTVAAQNIDVPNLDYNNDGPWQLYMATYNAEDSTSRIRLLFNQDYTIANYQSEYLRAAGSSQYSDRYNYPSIETLSSGLSSIIFGIIMIDGAGYARYRGTNVRKITSDIDLIEWGLSTDSPVTNITDIRIAASISDGLSIGTRLILTRLGH